MTQFGTWAGLLTAFFTMITAIGGLVAMLKVFIPNYKTNKDTHKIVNQQRTDMQRYTAVLENYIKAQGLEVPEDQSKLVPPPEEKRTR